MYKFEVSPRQTLLDAETPRRIGTPTANAGRLVCRLLLLIVFAGLLGCGTKATPTGLIYRVNPPGVSVQALRIDAAGQAVVTLRLANHSTVATTFAAIELDLVLDGAPPIAIVATPALGIPALSSDVAEFPIELGPAARLAIDRAQKGSALPYSIAGRITTADPGGRHKVEFASRVSPVPGRPGEFR